MTLSTAWRPRSERELLHAGGRSGGWGNLGCWTADTPDYASACEQLTRRVADAALLRPGARVLSLACGAGDELLWLAGSRACAEVIGVEHDAALVQGARERCAGRPVQVLHGDGGALDRLGLAPASFDQVLCVDAAYHFRPPGAFLPQALALLRPGGWLAYTDLCAEASAGLWRGPLLRAAARLCGVPAQSLWPAAAQVQRLRRLGFVDVCRQDFSEPVLGGFVRFMQRQARQVRPEDRLAWAAGARRARWTARLIGPCRAAGLGYVLLAARKPAWPSSDRVTA